MSDTIDTAIGLVASLLLIAANGVFVAAEFSLVAADRVRFGQDADRGDRVARRTLDLFRDLSFHLSGAQLGITITSLLLGFIAEPAIGDVLSSVFGDVPRGVSVAIALAVATVLQMVLGELVPKSVAITYPNGTARLLSAGVRLYGIVAGPIIWFFENTANAVVRALGIEPRGELDATRSLEELRYLFQSSAKEGTLAPEDVSLLTRSIRFAEKTAEDVLVPRVEIEAIQRDRTVADLVELAIDTGYSRYPVIGEDLDDVVGVVHVKSIYGLPVEARATTPVESIMSEVLAVPESRDLDELLVDFRASRGYLAVVVDEHGGTAGIVTLEDLLEEIVGEIDDEYDEEPAILTRVEEAGTYVLSGGLHPDEVLDATGFSLPDGEYETLAGFVLDRLGHIPEPGERFEHEGWKLEVVAMQRLRVATVRLVAPRHGHPRHEGRHEGRHGDGAEPGPDRQVTP